MPNAAYRHFASRDELLQAVRSAALAALAQAIEAEMAKKRRSADAAQAARAALRAVGTAYLRFALAEPGLFRTAFSVPGVPVEADTDAAKAGHSGLNPFQLLGAALDQMAAAGALPRARRRGAEYLAWSAVHGLAMLVLDGPLRRMSEPQLRAIGQRVVQMVERGLS